MSRSDTRLQLVDRQTLDAVRPEVASILQNSPAFRGLTPEEQKEVAARMVKVASYMANPDGLAAKSFDASARGALSKAQADAVEGAKQRAIEGTSSTRSSRVLFARESTSSVPWFKRWTSRSSSRG